jgi:hypothetical protein
MARRARELRFDNGAAGAATAVARMAGGCGHAGSPTAGSGAAADAGR